MRLAAGLVAAACAAALWLPAAAAAEPGELAGSVRDRAGDPLAGAVVTVVPEGCAAGGGPGCPEPVATSTAGDGTWRLEVAAGSYHVHVADPSGVSADQWWDGHVDAIDAVAVAAGGRRDGIDVDLAPAATIAGVVRDHTGAPLEGAVARTERTAFSPVDATTDERGRFRLRGLAGRTYDIGITSPEAGLGAASVRLVLADGAQGEVDVALPLTGLRVVRAAGPDRVATAVAASREAFDEADAVVVASAGSFPDALAAAPLAAALGGPLLLTGSSLPAVVAEEIGRLGASEAVIVGAIGAVPLVVQEDIRRLGVDVRRVPGETRFDTAALLGREVGAPGGEVVLASGGAFPDALSVAPLAAAGGLPILLSAQSSLVEDTAEALQALGAERVLVVGGGAAISGAVAERLPGVRRLSGPERYATSVAVAEEFMRRGGDLRAVYVATGHDFPDALAAGPVAALTGGPVLLVDGADAARSPASLEFLRDHGAGIAELWVFGGTAAVTDASLDRLVRARGGR